MKRQELETLHPGAWLVHSRYGLCELREIIRSHGHPEGIFGIVIRPKLPFGQAQLNEDSGSAVPDFCEDSLRRMSLYLRTAMGSAMSEGTPIQRSVCTICRQAHD